MDSVTLDHVGIAVSKIEALLPLYRDGLRLPVLGEEVVEAQGVKVLKLDAGGFHIELIEPLSGESPVGKFLAARGEGIHHLCFHVPDAAAFARTLKERGFRPLTDAPRPGASGRSVIFLNPKDAHGVLVELSSPAAGTPANA